MALRRGSPVIIIATPEGKVNHRTGPVVDQEALIREIVDKSRPGANVFLRKVQVHLYEPEKWSEFLVLVRDFLDKIHDPCHLILKFAKLVENNRELVTGSIELLSSDYNMEITLETRKTMIVTLTSPKLNNIPQRIVCNMPSSLLEYPETSLNPPPSTILKSSLKRKGSGNTVRERGVSFRDDLSSQNLVMSPRQSKRLRTSRSSESCVSMISPIPSFTKRSPGRRVNPQQQKPTVAEALSLFMNILSKPEKKNALLEFKDKKAQLVIDMMQTLLDVPDLPERTRANLRKALIKLSSTTTLPPTCFTLQNLVLEDLSPNDEPDGNFGEIHKGIFQNQRLCIKLVRIRRPSEIKKLVKAFWKEGLLWSQVNHPNILPFYGIYRLQDQYGRISLVSPWLNNGNVNSYLKRNQGVNRLLLVFDIIQGIEYLHRQHFVHGDIKGPNILVTKDGRACIADFGLATMDSETLGLTSVRSTALSGGTPRWQAPELLDDSDDLDEEPRPTMEADIYAFGCVMYEIFTGKFPFFETSAQFRLINLVVLQNKRPTRPDPFSQPWTQWGLTEKLWSCMGKCWDRDPKKRPTAAKLLERMPKMTSRRNSIGTGGEGGGRSLLDMRPRCNDEFLSSSAFRMLAHGTLNPLDDQAVGKVVGWLRELDTA